MVSHEAGEHEQVELGLTTFLTESCLVVCKRRSAQVVTYDEKEESVLCSAEGKWSV
jgi:hypothetical protein